MAIVPFPTITPDQLLEDPELEQFVKEANRIDSVEGGIASVGDAAAYALVWEWGNARQTQVGPKTVVGTNPDGERVYLSIQAPMGYVRVNTPEFLAVIDDEIGKISFRRLDAAVLKALLVKASANIGKRIADIIKDTVPVDSGQLKASITVVGPDDDLLASTDDENEIGSPHFGHAGLKGSKSNYTKL